MRLADLTWPQAERVLAQNPVVIFPIGTAEQHGRHLPLGTDMIAPEYIADRIEAMDPSVLILPSWSYGQCDSQTEFPGTISLGPQLLYEVILKVLSSLTRYGARRFIALNGHGPNTGPIERAALELRRRGAADTPAVRKQRRYSQFAPRMWTKAPMSLLVCAAYRLKCPRPAGTTCSIRA